jgi:threonine aldolase
VNFASDNAHPVAEPIMQAIVAANRGPAPSYGGDDWTARAKRALSATFEREVEVFLVASGTAANALSIAALTPPFGTVFCHGESHIQLEECGACEFYAGGAKLVPIEGFGAKITPPGLTAALERHRDVRHDMIPSALSLTNATECGTVYRIEEVSALADIAHGAGVGVHVDGARLANAVAGLGVAPADLTWRAGVDILSLGATKNGALAAEAVVVFDPARADRLAYRRKRGGHLLSKMRFLAAQIEAYLEDGRWLALAGHANAMAARLACGLAAVPGVRLPWPVEANEVFPVLPSALAEALRGAGAVFHPWTTVGLPADRAPVGGEILVRMVTSFATEPGEVDALLAAARRLA